MALSSRLVGPWNRMEEVEWPAAMLYALRCALAGSTAFELATLSGLDRPIWATVSALVFFLSLLVLVRAADFECGCRGSWQIGGYHLSFGVAYAAVIASSFGAFFPIRFTLRALQKKQRLAAAIVAHLLIWPLPVALIIFKFVH